MTNLKKKLFSITPGVLKKGTVATLCTVMMGLFLVVGCKKDNSATSGGNSGGKEGEVEEPEYPINVPFTEYTLTENCLWVPIPVEEYENFTPHVIIINSDKELENYITCWEGSYPKIDFSKQTLLLARGISSRYAYAICNSLQQLSEQSYEMKVDCFITMLGVITTWYAPAVVNKLAEECTVELLINKITER